MTKLIVEMKMPLCCWECACCNSEDVYCASRRKPIDDLNERPDWCPIVGVLPEEHGDLIDKETAKNAFDSSFLTFRMKGGETMRGFYQRTIDELPVLIAAERKDDGN